MNTYQSIAPDVKLGQNVKLSQFVNLYGCEVGDDTKIGAFVEIQKNARVGKRCKISSHTFVCEGVTIEDEVFVGHGVTFINDTYPRAATEDGQLQTEADWRVETTLIKKGASIGSGSTILSKVTVGEKAIVGAGSVVTRDVPARAIVAGNPARRIREIAATSSRRNEMTHTNAIPFLDLVTVHGELREELMGVFGAALETGGFIGGPMVEEFEYEFAKFCGTKYCVGVGSGTDAVRFALMADGIERNDIVLTVPNTFIATAEAISQAGAIPDFVDVDELTYNLSPRKVREYLEVQCRVDTNGRVMHKESGRRVAAVVPVHLYGQPADMDAILEIAQQYHLSVIEDACQAHGAEYFSAGGGRWRKAGSMGRAAASSFYPGKNLGACGEAGAITTDDGELARRVRMLRDHGQVRKYYHETEGYNGRLDAIQAGILRVKLKYLADWNAKPQAGCRPISGVVRGSRFGPASAIRAGVGEECLSPVRHPRAESGRSDAALG